VSPRIVLVTHWVLSPDPDVLSSPEQVQLVNFLIKMFPIQHMGHPSESISNVEHTQSYLPAHGERVNEEQIPTERYRSIQKYIRIFEVHNRVLDVVAGVE